MVKGNAVFVVICDKTKTCHLKSNTVQNVLIPERIHEDNKSELSEEDLIKTIHQLLVLIEESRVLYVSVG